MAVTVGDLQIKVLDTIDKELTRIHEELDNHSSTSAIYGASGTG